MSDPQDQAEALDEDVVDPDSDRSGDSYGEALFEFPPDEPLGVEEIGTTPVEEDAGESFAERAARHRPEHTPTPSPLGARTGAAPEELAMHVERESDRPAVEGGRFDLERENDREGFDQAPDPNSP